MYSAGICSSRLVWKVRGSKCNKMYCGFSAANPFPPVLFTLPAKVWHHTTHLPNREILVECCLQFWGIGFFFRLSDPITRRQHSVAHFRCHRAMLGLWRAVKKRNSQAIAVVVVVVVVVENLEWLLTFFWLIWQLQKHCLEDAPCFNTVQNCWAWCLVKSGGRWVERKVWTPSMRTFQ